MTTPEEAAASTVNLTRVDLVRMLREQREAGRREGHYNEHARIVAKLNHEGYHDAAVLVEHEANPRDAVLATDDQETPPQAPENPKDSPPAPPHTIGPGAAYDDQEGE